MKQTPTSLIQYSWWQNDVLCIFHQIHAAFIGQIEKITCLTERLRKSSNQEYRYLGGAVGIVNYDAIRLVENIPNRHLAQEPLMEFGIYDDGILYDNLHKKLFYFYYDENRFDQLKISSDSFESFHASEVIPNMNKEEFSNRGGYSKKK